MLRAGPSCRAAGVDEFDLPLCLPQPISRLMWPGPASRTMIPELLHQLLVADTVNELLVL
jgi:hypothetical protein